VYEYYVNVKRSLEIDKLKKHIEIIILPENPFDFNGDV